MSDDHRDLDAQDLETLKVSTKAVYERQAVGWDRHRPKNLLEKPWLDRFLSRVPANGTVLDLGCGAGEPIVGYLLDQGRAVVGTDYSKPMLDIARRRYPAATFVEQDMRYLDLRGTFQGALSWDGSFHLSASEQADLIAKLALLLDPGAPLMLTVGTDHSEVTGVVEGKRVYHASLSEDGYRECLEKNGFKNSYFRFNDPDCDLHSVLFAVRSGEIGA